MAKVLQHEAFNEDRLVCYVKTLALSLYLLAIIAFIVVFPSSGSEELGGHLVAYVKASGAGAHSVTLLCFLEIPGGLNGVSDGGFILRAGLGLPVGFYGANVSLGDAVVSSAVCIKLSGLSSGGLFTLNISRIAFVGAKPYIIGYGSSLDGYVVLLAAPLLFLIVTGAIYAVTILFLKRINVDGELKLLSKELGPFLQAFREREHLLAAATSSGGLFVLVLVSGYPSLAIYSLGLAVLLVLALLLDYLAGFDKARNKLLLMFAFLLGALTNLMNVNIIIKFFVILSVYIITFLYITLFLLYILAGGKAKNLYNMLLVFMFFYIAFTVFFFFVRSGFIAALLAAPLALMLSLAMPILLGLLDTSKDMLLRDWRRVYLGFTLILATFIISLGAALSLLVDNYYWVKVGPWRIFAISIPPLASVTLGYPRSTCFWEAVRLGLVGAILEALVLAAFSLFSPFRLTAIVEVFSWNTLLVIIINITYILRELYSASRALDH